MKRILTLIIMTTALSALGGQDVTVPAEDLKAAATRYIVDRTDADPNHVTLTFLHLPDQVTVGQPVDEISVLPGAPGLFRGSSLLYIGLYAGGELLKKVPVTVRARILKPVLVSTRMIDRHVSLAPDMVKIELMDVTRLSGVPLQAGNDFTGLQTSRIIASGRVLLDSMVEKPPAVLRGDQVIISVSIGTVTASAPGEVRADGRIGEYVRVRNLQSGREMVAKVQDARHVVIDSPRRRSP